MSEKISFKKVLPHLVALAIFLIINVIMYFPLFFEGKKLNQNDILQGAGANQEIVEYREATGEEALWTNGMFSGMPAYLINVQWSGDLLKYIPIGLEKIIPTPVSYNLIAMLCFYALLLVFKINPYLAMAGGLTYGLNTFMIISIEAGHIWKVAAIAWMPLVLAGIVLVFQRKYLLGFIITAFSLAMEIRSNHYQITYYLLLIVLIYGLLKLIALIKSKELPHLGKSLGILTIAALLAVGANLGKLWSAYEYGAFSIRGASELTSNTQSTSGGLDRDYAFAWSNGIWEPLTFLVPNYYGGATTEEVSMDSELAKGLKKRGAGQGQVRSFVKSVPTYWGDQPFTSGPYYLGAVVLLIFFIGAFLVKGPIKWWLVAATVLGIVLSWGDNFSALNYFIFDYLPGYNKFRAVSMTVAIPFLCVPLLGFIGLQKLFNEGYDQHKKGLYLAFMTTGGILLLLLISTYLMRFRAPVDERFAEQAWLVELIQVQRASMARADVLRSLLMVVLAFGIVWAWSKKKIKAKMAYLIFVGIILIDFVPVAKRYLNDENFISNPKKKFFNKSAADLRINEDENHFRVLNLNNPFNEARTSYYHASIGGYHGAKMRRYQDVITRHIQPEMNAMVELLRAGETNLSDFGVINMLNTKYIKFGNDAGQVLKNEYANGNAWFVSNIQNTQNPDETIEALGEINTKNTAVINTNKTASINSNLATSGSIMLQSYSPNEMIYKSKNSGSALAVFSEIYYPKGWKAYIDDKETDILQANYILRALEIPEGEHVIKFTFEPAAYHVGNKVMYFSTAIILLLGLAYIILSIYRREKRLD